MSASPTCEDREQGSDLDAAQRKIEDRWLHHDCVQAAIRFGFTEAEDLRDLISRAEYRYNDKDLLVKLKGKEMGIDEAARKLAQANPHLLTARAVVDRHKEGEALNSVSSIELMTMGYNEARREQERLRREQKQPAWDSKFMTSMSADQLLAHAYGHEDNQGSK